MFILRILLKTALLPVVLILLLLKTIVFRCDATTGNGPIPQPVIRESGLGVRGLASRLGRCSSLREGRPLEDRNLSQRYGDMAELAKALPR